MIVLDANIMIRAVLGRRVRQLIEKYSPRGIRFYAPEVAFEDAAKYLPALLQKLGKPSTDVPATLEYLRQFVEPVDQEVYGGYEEKARERLGGRDENDWTILGSATQPGSRGMDRRRRFFWDRCGGLDHESHRDFSQIAKHLRRGMMLRLKSHAAITRASLWMKVSQLCLGSGVRTGWPLCKYFPTVRGDTRMPSFSFNSLTMRSSPQVGFSMAARTTSRTKSKTTNDTVFHGEEDQRGLHQPSGCHLTARYRNAISVRKQFLRTTTVASLA
jgi:hypothetical protein